MYLLKPDTLVYVVHLPNGFTFHYVSIKTNLQKYRSTLFRNLHSTMYLLKRRNRVIAVFINHHLHSTMYLLKHTSLSFINNTECKFTFHYVSIKTYWYMKLGTRQANLHSTMYLLKLNSLNLKSFSILKFTFHYVSIKTEEGKKLIKSIIAFTFHYVSIKTF